MKRGRRGEVIGFKLPDVGEIWERNEQKSIMPIHFEPVIVQRPKQATKASDVSNYQKLIVLRSLSVSH